MDYTISLAELKQGHKVYEEHEYRDLFYRAATELISMAIGKEDSQFPVEDALAVLLETWNRTVFRFQKIDRRKFFHELETLLHKHHDLIRNYRSRSIENLEERDRDSVCDLFTAFESACVGPVGAAKALHLLAPRFFPFGIAELPRHTVCPSARPDQTMIGIGNSC